MDNAQDALLIVNGEPLGAQALLQGAQWQDALEFLSQAVDRLLIRQAAAAQGIEATQAELDAEAVTFRRRHDLLQASALLGWLERRKQTTGDWQAHLSETITARKLREAVCAPDVQAYFVQHRLEFEQATVARLLVSEESAAHELKARIVEDGEDFYTLARRYSQDAATRPVGGYMGRVGRKTLPPVLEAAIFGAQTGQVAGPLKTSQGWHLVLVEALYPAALDDATRGLIVAELFADWLRQQRQAAQICTPQLEGVF